MNLFAMLQVSGSALTAERWRAEVASANMANAETTRTAQGGAYRRQLVVFRARNGPRFPLLLAGISGGGIGGGIGGGMGNGMGSGMSFGMERPLAGVQVDQVVYDPSPLPRRYEPGHPDADAAGYVTYPNVNPVMEMADLLSAVRAYQLNAAAVQAAKSMIQQSLQILS